MRFLNLENMLPKCIKFSRQISKNFNFLAHLCCAYICYPTEAFLAQPGARARARGGVGAWKRGEEHAARGGPQQCVSARAELRAKGTPPRALAHGGTPAWVRAAGRARERGGTPRSARAGPCTRARAGVRARDLPETRVQATQVGPAHRVRATTPRANAAFELRWDPSCARDRASLQDPTQHGLGCVRSGDRASRARPARDEGGPTNHPPRSD